MHYIRPQNKNKKKQRKRKKKGAVVYLLQGRVGRFTVWVNGKQNSGVVNFLSESRLPFAQISSTCQKTAAKAWNWYQRRLWRNGTRISVWNIPSGKTGLPFKMFRYPLTTQKVVFHLLSTRIFRKVFVNGKEPACTWTQNMQLVFLWSINFTFSKWPL